MGQIITFVSLMQINLITNTLYRASPIKRRDAPQLKEKLMKHCTIFTSLLIGACIVGCSNDSISSDVYSSDNSYSLIQSQKERIKDPGTTVEELQQTVDSNSQFAFDLLRNLTIESEANRFFSPYSISVAFSMIYAGARTQTAKELSTVFHFSPDQDRHHRAFNTIDSELKKLSTTNNQLLIGNSIWAQRDDHFEEPFLDIMAQQYSAGIFGLNFRNGDDNNRIIINEWAKSKTANLIPELLPQGSIDMDTRLVLVNTIYMNALWQFPFGNNMTSKGTFIVQDGTNLSINFMRMIDAATILHNINESLVSVELPYKESSLVMDIFMPKDKSLNEFVKSLSIKKYTEIVDALQSGEIKVELPKFSLKPDLLDLRSILGSMGLSAPFSSNSADFSGITSSDNIYIKDAYHKAVLDVFEGGTIAVGATAMIITTDTVALSPVKIIINRPFIVNIRDTKTGVILFLGAVSSPAL